MNEDKLVRYLINEGLVRVDDIPDEQAVGEAIIVMEGMQHKISALQARVEALEGAIENSLKRLNHFPSPDNLEEQREHNHHRVIKTLEAILKGEK